MEPAKVNCYVQDVYVAINFLLQCEGSSVQILPCWSRWSSSRGNWM